MASIWIQMIDKIVLVLLQVVIMGVLAVIIRHLPMMRLWLQHHTTLAERRLLEQIGREAFTFAEAALHGASGQDKLAEAFRYGSLVIDKLGLNITPDELRFAIERAVAQAKALESTHCATANAK